MHDHRPVKNIHSKVILSARCDLINTVNLSFIIPVKIPTALYCSPGCLPIKLYRKEFKIKAYEKFRIFNLLYPRYLYPIITQALAQIP